MTDTTHWLHPVRQSLDAADPELTVFFRDDDAGWADSHLTALLDVFRDHRTPIDLAVIPAAVSPALTDDLRSRKRADPKLLGLHQHGYDHTNHQHEGRKCEFGSDRSRDRQLDDLRRGQALLNQLLGEHLDPIFTPPWNRCTQDTADGLRELGFRVLSRTRTAAPLDCRGLIELGVSVDWCRDGIAAGEARLELGRRIAAALLEPGPAGIMLHHAVMNEDDAAALAELLELLNGHPKPRLALMHELAENGGH